MPGSALVIETLRGLQRFGSAQLAYFHAVVFQSLVLLLWWPASSALAAEQTPATLFAVLLALSVSLSYQSMRLGAEELLLPGQRSYREWLLSTRLPLTRLLSGYLLAHLIQTLHWLLLSLPVLLIAWSVGGSNWTVLAISLLAITLLATVLRLLAANIYLLLGHYGELCWYSLRILLALVYIAPALLSPLISYWHLARDLLIVSYSGGESKLLMVFLLIYSSCLVLLYLLFARFAADIRRRQGSQ